MRRLAVLTSDFALYHDLVRALRERGLVFDSLSFGERPSAHVGAIIVSWRDALRPDLPKDVPIVPVPLDASGGDDVATAVAQATRILEGVVGYREVVMGIDPGKRPGLALLADGRLLHTAQLVSPLEVSPLVRSLASQFPADRYVVRIGNGSPRERDDIVAALEGLAEPEVRVEVVDETGTTPPPGRRPGRTSHVAAAVEISRQGGHLAPRPRRHVSAGEIGEVQRESRILSQGRFTISRDLARRVARGDLSLWDAVAEEERSLTQRPKSQSSSR